MISNPATWTAWWASEHLRQLFDEKYPAAARVAALDAREAVLLIPDVELIEDASLRPARCQIAGTYDAHPPVIRYRPLGTRRDNFTLLHEVGHHLLAYEKSWCYQVAPALDRQRLGTAGYTEETFVNTFAADVLISPETASDAFSHGVTSESCVALFEQGAASATACLVRGLKEPGSRLVMLCDHDGQVWFSASNGDPYSPGRGVSQPAVARGVERAMETSGTTRFAGGEGLHFKSGKTFSAVQFDITLHGALAFVIVERTATDSRVDSVDHYTITCLECGEEFLPPDSRNCETCREPKCPRCRACTCPSKAMVCDKCFETLPVVLKAAGATRHEDCG